MPPSVVLSSWRANWLPVLVLASGVMVHPTRSSSNLPVALVWKSRDIASFVPTASVLHWKVWAFQLKIELPSRC